MKNRKTSKQHVNRSYWKEDLNCATTLMKNLAHEFSIELNDQVIQSLTGMMEQVNMVLNVD